MTKSMVKPKNILLTLKEHNADSYTTIKQIYNADNYAMTSLVRLARSAHDIMFVHVQQVYLKDHCPLPPPALLWSTNCYSQAKQWAIPYISRMQEYTSLMSFKTHYVDLNED
ncbi:hypothetical protein HKD37_15G042581 [Glycine soja]